MTRLTKWLNDSKPSDVGPPRTSTDEEQLVADAYREGLAGLILEHSSRHSLPLAPTVAARLERRATAVAARNLQLNTELERILHVLNRANIPVILLKGAALNLTLYPRLDLRPMSDLDLLVRPQDADRAVRALTEQGCRRGMDLVRDGFFPQYHYECELISGSVVPVRIDLHARPLRPLRYFRTMPTDAFWEDARVVRVGQSEGLIPSLETMFIHLAAHAAFHGCSRALWLYDIKRFADDAGHTMDWSLVLRRSCEWRLSLPVQRAIECATDLYGPCCPQSVLDRLGKRGAGWCDRLTLWQTPRDAASPLAHILANLLCTPGWGFRLGYAMAYLLPGRAHLAGLYPYRHRGWVACAHIWRFVRVIKRVLRIPWGRPSHAERKTRGQRLTRHRPQSLGT